MKKKPWRKCWIVGPCDDGYGFETEAEFPVVDVDLTEPPELKPGDVYLDLTTGYKFKVWPQDSTTENEANDD
jgi:hypothetical protein